MNEIQIFQNQEFGAIRTMTNELGEVMFCAKDVCDALGYRRSNDAVRVHVEIDDTVKRSTVDSLGRKNIALFVNESGLYALILLPSADGNSSLCDVCVCIQIGLHLVCKC